MKKVFTKSKILATVGPACNTYETLLELAIAGVDVFRLNFSHGSHEEHLKIIELIRKINNKFNFNVGILQDLQGPKIRIDEMENGGVLMEEGHTFIIHTDQELLGNAQRVSCTYTSLSRDVKNGDAILVDDGKIELKVIQVVGKEVHVSVTHGGVLKSRKGMNLPDTDISSPSLTDKDHKDLLFGIKHEVDWIALSFVRRADDIVKVKEIIAENKKQCRVISKIERPEAIKNIDKIIAVSDAVMVARGDLGVEMKLEEVPILQKRIVKKCNQAGKPVIIATQMMESMITNLRPTRAETNDVANAVMDGADCLMLSGETAVGKFPLEVIKSMVNTIVNVEQNLEEEIYYKTYPIDPKLEDMTSRSIVDTACKLARDTKAKALVGMTQSGYTAFLLASHRPKANIFIFTGNKRLLTTLSLVWGVRGFYYDKFSSSDETFADTQAILVKEQLLVKGDLMINTASMPINFKGRTNMLKIWEVE